MSVRSSPTASASSRSGPGLQACAYLQACPHVDDAKPEFDELIEIDLVAGARSRAGATLHHGA